MVNKANLISSKIYGQSMFPTLKNEDILFIQKRTPQNIKKRELIVFTSSTKQNQYHICHRFICKKDKTHYLTKGDFHIKYETLNKFQIIGVVIAVKRRNKIKSISYEKTYLYYLYTIVIAITKNLLELFLETIYKYKFIRKYLKKIFPITTQNEFIKNIQQHHGFKSLYNKDYQKIKNIHYSCGFISKHKQHIIAKLWAIQDTEGKWYIDGLYVKIGYRGRHVGKNLITYATNYLKNHHNQKNIYPLTTKKSALNACYKNSFKSCNIK